MTEKYIIAKDEIAALLKGETFTLQPPLHNGVTAFRVEINEELLTNGDVIKAVFKARDLSIIQERLEHTHWWNAKYKAESEDKE